MTVYHWTTKAKAQRILREGLRKDSFVCREPSDWRGEVCLKIDLDVDWEHREGQMSWQGLAPYIPPQQITHLLGPFYYESEISLPA